MYFSLSSNLAAELGQEKHDISDANGPQIGNVALHGMASIHEIKVAVGAHPQNDVAKWRLLEPHISVSSISFHNDYVSGVKYVECVVHLPP